MTDYSDHILRDIGLLKQAAIDAYMVEQGYHYDEKKNYYEYFGTAYNSLGDTHRKPEQIDMHHTVQRPDKRGESGGDYYWFGDPRVAPHGTPQKRQSREYHDLFDSIGGSISGIFKGYDSIPNPEVFDGTIITAMIAVSECTTKNSRDLGGGSDFTAAFNAAEMQFAFLHGLTSDAYYELLERLSIVVANVRDLAVAVCASARGEQEIYRQAQNDVISIILSATACFRARADAGTYGLIDWPQIFKTASAIISGISSIADKTIAAPVTKVMEGSFLILKAISEADANHKPQAPKVLSYDAIIDAMVQTLSELSASIKCQERSAWDAMKENANIVDAGLASTDQPFSIVNTLSADKYRNPGTITASDPDAVQIMCGHVDEIITTVILASRTAAYELLESSPWSRPQEIGISTSGFSKMWFQAVWSLYDCLGKIAESLADANADFKAVSGKFSEADAEYSDQYGDMSSDPMSSHYWNQHEHIDDNSLGGF